jgi:hypothetical protein
MQGVSRIRALEQAPSGAAAAEAMMLSVVKECGWKQTSCKEGDVHSILANWVLEEEQVNRGAELRLSRTLRLPAAY